MKCKTNSSINTVDPSQPSALHYLFRFSFAHCFSRYSWYTLYYCIIYYYVIMYYIYLLHMYIAMHITICTYIHIWYYIISYTHISSIASFMGNNNLTLIWTNFEIPILTKSYSNCFQPLQHSFVLKMINYLNWAAISS